MATDNVTSLDSSAPVDAAETPRREKAPCYDRLVAHISTLECVSAALSEWDLRGRPTGSECRIGSAELVLSQTIEALHDLTDDVKRLEDSNNVREAEGVVTNG